MDEWKRDGRRALRDALGARLASHGSTSLLQVDLDRMLWFNDTFGHDAGDAALAQVWAALAEVAGADHLYRTAGATYSVLVDLEAREAMQLGEALRAAVAARRIANPKPPDGPGWLTVSVGVVTHDAGAGPLTVAKMLALADQRCYQAKAAGRDRVVGEDPAPAGAVP